MKQFVLNSHKDVIEAVRWFGFLPFFANEIEGFSIEEMTPARYWFTEEPGAWEWKGPAISEGDCVYGKFFAKKAGFVSNRWFPDFANKGENQMVIKIILEGLLLGALLVLFCAVGIRNGAVNMVFLYHQDVQESCMKNGLITSEKIRKNEMVFKCLAIPVYFLFVLVSTYLVNGARGFWQGFSQMFAILSIVNLIDRIYIDEYWVGHTKDWKIPGTEDMKPYINRKDKIEKWLMGTVGFALLSALLSGMMSLFLK